MTTTETPAGMMRRAAAEMRTEGGWVWAVADWLEEVADDRHPELPAWVDDGALRIAHAYLGETPVTTGETP